MKDFNLKITNEDKTESNDIGGLKSKYLDFNKTYGFRRINPFVIYIAATIISLIWIGIIWYYSANSIYSWNSLLKMLPHEFGGFLAGTIMPIGFIWMIALYIDKNINSNYEQQVIYPFLQSIIDPHGDTSTITNVIKEKISIESNELKKTIDNFTNSAKILEDIHFKIAGNIVSSVELMKIHETTLKSISSHFKEETETSENISKNILNNISQSLSIINESTIAIDAKTSQITHNLIRESKNLESTLTTTTMQVDNFVDKIKDQTTNLDGLTKYTLNTGNLLEEKFDKVNTKILSSSEVAQLRATEILKNINEKTNDFVVKSNIAAERIHSASEEITKLLKAVSGISNENKKLSYDALDQISKESQGIKNKLTEQTKIFEGNSSSILQTVSGIETRFKNIGSIMTGISDGIITNFQSIGAEINNQKDNVFATTTQLAEKIHNLSSQISSEKNNFIKSIIDVKDITTQTTDSIKSSSNEIIATANNIKSATGEINDLINDTSNNLNNQAQKTLKFAGDIKSTLSNQISDLENVVNTVSAQTRIGEISIEQQGEKLSHITENLFIKIDTMNGKISSSINNIINLSSQIDDKFKLTSDTILQKTNTATKLISDGVEKTILSTNQLANLSHEFNQNSKTSTLEIITLISELKGQSLNLETFTKSTTDLIGTINAETIKISKIIPELNNIGTVLDNNIKSGTTNIDKAVEITAHKTKQLIDNLNNISGYFTKFAMDKSSQMETIANSSTQTITKVASYANKLNHELSENLEKFGLKYNQLQNSTDKDSGQTALNKAGFILEKLHSLSIDISRILNPDTSMDLWNKYNSGHKNVFSKYLTQELSRKQLSDIQSLILNNKEFATHTKQYISEFDSLIIKARSTDKSELLLSTITSTDIGKIYMILKEVI